MMSISEAARETPILAECDLCVLGGTCRRMALIQ